MYKNNSRGSSEFKGYSPHQLSCFWKGNTRVGYIFLYSPLPAMLGQPTFPKNFSNACLK